MGLEVSGAVLEAPTGSRWKPGDKVCALLGGGYAEALPRDLDWCVEPRNPQWLDGAYFGLLRQFDLGDVFQQGDYMPPVARVYGQYADKRPRTFCFQAYPTPAPISPDVIPIGRPATGRFIT